MVLKIKTSELKDLLRRQQELSSDLMYRRMLSCFDATFPEEGKYKEFLKNAENFISYKKEHNQLVDILNLNK